MTTLQEHMHQKERVTKTFFLTDKKEEKKKKNTGEDSEREFQERSGQQVKQVRAVITTRMVIVLHPVLCETYSILCETEVSRLHLVLEHYNVELHLECKYKPTLDLVYADNSFFSAPPCSPRPTKSLFQKQKVNTRVY